MCALKISILSLFISIVYFIFLFVFFEYTFKLSNQMESPIDDLINNCSKLSYELKGDLSIRYVDFSINPLENIANMNPNVQPGGYFSPKTCSSSESPIDSVAIVVPFRDRYEHLLIFLQHMHPLLTRQKLEYKIYVINQIEGDPFNRGKLINIGYKEAMKDRNWSCLIMHDVDYLPLNDKNIYTCGPQPRRLIAASSKWSFVYALPYLDNFGGVAAVTPKQFETVNGFNNDYYGWGAEDDDLVKRLHSKGMKIDMLDEEKGMEIGKYMTLSHAPAKPADDRIERLKHASSNMPTNGLNSLEYKVISNDSEILYTNITVDLLYQKPK